MKLLNLTKVANCSLAHKRSKDEHTAPPERCATRLRYIPINSGNIYYFCRMATVSDCKSGDFLASLLASRKHH